MSQQAGFALARAPHKHARMHAHLTHTRTHTPCRCRRFGAALPFALPSNLSGLSLLPLLRSVAGLRTYAGLVYLLSAPVFYLKQLISVIHLVRAAQRVVGLDEADLAAKGAAPAAAAVEAGSAAPASSSGKKKTAAAASTARSGSRPKHRS